MDDLVIPNEAVDAFLGGDSGTNVIKRTENGLRAAAPAILEANRAQLDTEAERRGAVKALRQIAMQYGDERVGDLTVRGNVEMSAHTLARAIESGEVSL